MTLKTLFEKEGLVRVSEDQSTLICTTSVVCFPGRRSVV